ncbi:hypothetical protein ASU31_12660 [Pedobacter ginsenosidimutans]|uniref:Glycosyl transferase family 1 domain-containing protein n=1 Tax=Pedobacter ginsenosidimutans TaxID=687842 RepID=A0A0T5VPQ4_9SPHI|nr:glycosyltransferase [Pedobacter ginsenosidimutans]KRT15830.1 hypothetical protein ASU31_12660 [Pedobacter ginsenosidimutans]
MKNIYFISESTPGQGFGSYVIFYRHLIRLKQNNYKVHIVIPNYKNIFEDDSFIALQKEFTVLLVPFRKWWYPPYRFNHKLLRTFRYLLLYLGIRNYLVKNPPFFILTYFYLNYLNGFSVFLKKIFKCKLGIFLHDDKYLLAGQTEEVFVKYDLFLTQQSNIIWTVSNRLKIPNSDILKYITLPPIPEGKTVREKKLFTDKYLNPIIGFSGTLYPSYLPLLKMIAELANLFDGKLKIISSSKLDLNDYFENNRNVEIINSFKNNIDSLNFLGATCSAIFCGYPNDLDAMPWLISSFPSKFVEYSHTGLPIIITSAEGTALSDWAKSNNWELFTSDITLNGIKLLIEKIAEKNSWQRLANQTHLLAEKQFNPEIIQTAFENSFNC